MWKHYLSTPSTPTGLTFKDMNIEHCKLFQVSYNGFDVVFIIIITFGVMTYKFIFHNQMDKIKYKSIIPNKSIRLVVHKNIRDHHPFIFKQES